MSRRKTKPEEIRNPEHYFNRMVALEIERDRIATAEYQSRFQSIEAMLEGGEEGPRRGSEMLLATNSEDNEFDRYLEASSFLGWIEAFKNPTLYEAVQSLSYEDQRLLTYRFKEGLTQEETAIEMQIPQTKVSYHERKIKKFIKEFFEKVAKKS